MTGKPPIRPEPHHDHARCIAATLAVAERICVQRKLRLTQQRRRVLEIVARSHAAIGAYAIMEHLAGEGRRPAPISVYRALEFLMRHGLVHRLASLNAYVSCARPSGHHGAQFLICKRCGTIAEMTSAAVDDAIAERARAAGFAITTPVVEVAGVCARCRPPAGRIATG